MTEREFSQALRRGLGGAIIALKNSENKAAYRDIVLRYCLRDISYDWQVEGTKGYYLYSAICASGERDYFEQAIIEKFLLRCEDRLFRQLTDILSCCAKDGSVLAKDALHAKYEYFSALKGRFAEGRIVEVSQWEDVALSLFSIDGFSAFKRHAIDVGELLSRNPNRSYCDWFITEAEDTFGKKRTHAFLDKMYEKSDAIKILMDTIKADEFSRKQYQENYKEEQVTVEALVQTAKEMASDKISHYGPIMRLRHPFLNNASDADVLELAHIILSEKNETVKGLLLRIFLSNMKWNKPFPLGATPLFEYAKSDNNILYESALGLLEAFKDKRIHDLGVQLLKTKGIKSFALGLFKKNYRKSDDAIISKAVKKAPSIPQYVQSDVIDIYSRHRSADALPALLHVYQKGACSHCRYNIVKAMHYCKVLPDVILEECLYDSYKDTRKFAKRLIARRSVTAHSQPQKYPK
jgi:hypothetical protein